MKVIWQGTPAQYACEYRLLDDMTVQCFEGIGLSKGWNTVTNREFVSDVYRAALLAKQPAPQPAQPSPGPWTVDEAVGVIVIRAANCDPVARVARIYSADSNEVQRANACLMAGAWKVVRDAKTYLKAAERGACALECMAAREDLRAALAACEPKEGVE